MEDRNIEDQSVTFLAMELNQSSTYYALVSSYMYMYYGSLCCQFMCNG